MRPQSILIKTEKGPRFITTSLIAQLGTTERVRSAQPQLNKLGEAVAAVTASFSSGSVLELHTFAARVVAGMIAGAMQSRCARSVPDGGEDAGHLALVAGSIRRGKQRVKDIEIVACPRWHQEPDPTDLLGERTIRRNLLFHEWGIRQSVIQWIKPGTNDIVPWRIQESGKYWRGYIPSLRVFGSGAPELSCKVDIFLTEPDNFGLIYLIRTGSAEFSTEVATYALRVGYKVDRGYLWRVRGLAEPRLIPTPTEADVFRELNLQWVEPADRTSADRVRAGWNEDEQH